MANVDNVLRTMLTDVQNAASQYKVSVDKWFSAFQTLPLLIFELGGDNGADFALAILSVFGGHIPGLRADVMAKVADKVEHARKTPNSLVERFRQQLLPMATVDIETFDTFGFLSQVSSNPTFRDELIHFAVYQLPLHHHRKVYEWTCYHVFGVMTTQQSGESVFSFLDRVRQGNMTWSTLFASVYLEMASGRDRTVTKAQKMESQRRIKTRPKDYSTIRHMLECMKVTEEIGCTFTFFLRMLAKTPSDQRNREKSVVLSQNSVLVVLFVRNVTTRLAPGTV